jgi:hypothetical protein
MLKCNHANLFKKNANKCIQTSIRNHRLHNLMRCSDGRRPQKIKVSSERELFFWGRQYPVGGEVSGARPQGEMSLLCHHSITAIPLTCMVLYSLLDMSHISHLHGACSCVPCTVRPGPPFFISLRQKHSPNIHVISTADTEDLMRLPAHTLTPPTCYQRACV